MQFKDILYEVKDEYAHVTINRPKVLNAFTPVTLHELKAALDAAEKDKEVGVIVLSGAGDRAFSVSYTHLRAPRDISGSRMPSSA